jgi:hypothetical protein
MEQELLQAYESEEEESQETPQEERKYQPLHLHFTHKERASRLVLFPISC